MPSLKTPCAYFLPGKAMQGTADETERLPSFSVRGATVGSASLMRKQSSAGSLRKVWLALSARP